MSNNGMVYEYAVRVLDGGSYKGWVCRDGWDWSITDEPTVFESHEDAEAARSIVANQYRSLRVDIDINLLLFEREVTTVRSGWHLKDELG